MNRFLLTYEQILFFVQFLRNVSSDLVVVRFFVHRQRIHDFDGAFLFVDFHGVPSLSQPQFHIFSVRVCSFVVQPRRRLLLLLLLGTIVRSVLEDVHEIVARREIVVLYIATLVQFFGDAARNKIFRQCFFLHLSAPYFVLVAAFVSAALRFHSSTLYLYFGSLHFHQTRVRVWVASRGRSFLRFVCVIAFDLLVMARRYVRPLKDIVTPEIAYCLREENNFIHTFQGLILTGILFNLIAHWDNKTSFRIFFIALLISLPLTTWEGFCWTFDLLD